MKKLIACLFASVMFFANPVLADLAIGVTANFSSIDTDGSETLKTSELVTTGSVKEEVVVPSAFLEYALDLGLTLGFEYVPVNAELGSNKATRVDKLAGGNVTVNQNAQAEISDHWTVYLETPAIGWGNAYGVFGENGLYLTAKHSELTVTTDESLGTGSSYGDATVEGTTFGAGVRTKLWDHMLVKLEASYTDYDEIILYSSGSDAVSTIKAEPDAAQVRLSIGFSF